MYDNATLFADRPVADAHAIDMAPADVLTVTLASETDWPGFRREARTLLARGVPPGSVHWHTPASALQDLYAHDTPTPPPDAPPAPPLAVPPAFVTLCESVVLHRDPDRFGLLYRLLWRLAHEPSLRHDRLDPDLLQAQALARAVRRDMHKMTAFVRFRTLPAPAAEANEGEEPMHVAWFEPEHHIVEATAPFFMRRFTRMRWAIVTPGCSVQWDGRELAFGPGGRRDETPPADAGEALWLTYYRHIFNPARLKLAMMQKEMPRRYWRNLPEAELIAPLAAQALSRTGRMIEAPSTVPARRVVRLAPVPAPDDREAPADPAQALAALQRATGHCRDCPLGANATQSVFGTGPVGAALMVVGEQPGDQEDLLGRPFMGPAGQLFDRALAELGWSREAMYLTNAVKHFKYQLRGKRRIHKTPAQREAEACLHWLEREIELVRPQALLALGGTAARALLGRPVAVLDARGHWHAGVHGLPVLVTLHPAALLRGDPARQGSAWRQWLDDLALAGMVLAPRPAAPDALHEHGPHP